MADLVALGLEAGLPTAAAVELATRDGTAVPAVVRTTLAVSAELGAPVGPAARSAALVLRERARADEATSALAAGPRASMTLLTALPLLGPLALSALGMPVGAVYGTPLAAVIATLGVALTGAGWATSRAIVRRAERPTRVQRPARGGAR